MPKITRILVPTDFSECSRLALEHAVELAERYGAQLELLHVVEIPAGLAPTTMILPDASGTRTTVEDYLYDTAQERLVEERTALSQHGIAAGYAVKHGTPQRTILEHIEEIGADLVVIGTHGRTGIGHLLLGSVAEKVVRRSPVPVLTIRGEAA